MYKYCILLLIPLIWISCSNHPKEETSQTVESESVQPAESEADTVKYVLESITKRWSATLPELDIESNKMLDVMISDAISTKRRYIHDPFNRKYIIVSGATSLVNKNYYDLRIELKSFGSDNNSEVFKKDYNGYFYCADSIIVFSVKGNPMGLKPKRDGVPKLFHFYETELYDNDIIREEPTLIDYIMSNDSLYRIEYENYYNSIGPSLSLVAHRKPGPLVYKRL